MRFHGDKNLWHDVVGMRAEPTVLVFFDEISTRFPQHAIVEQKDISTRNGQKFSPFWWIYPGVLDLAVTEISHCDCDNGDLDHGMRGLGNLGHQKVMDRLLIRYAPKRNKPGLFLIQGWHFWWWNDALELVGVPGIFKFRSGVDGWYGWHVHHKSFSTSS